MSSFEDTWHTATVDDNTQQSNFDPPPDGEHVAELRKASGVRSKKEEDWIILELREIRSGHDWTVMRGFRPMMVNITKSTCARLGIDVDAPGLDWEGLKHELEQCQGNYYEVTVQTNGEFRNTYVNGPARNATQTLPGTDVPVDESDFQPPAVPDLEEAPW